MVIYAELYGTRIRQWSSSFIDEYMKIEIPDNHPMLHSLDNTIYHYLDGKVVGVNDNEYLLEEMKKSKSYEMNRECQKTILSGFLYSLRNLTYHFSYDTEAQANFQETFRLFENGIIKNIIWSARLNGGKVRLPLIKEEFYQVYFASVKHKFDTISKYNDVLVPLINQAKTVEEVEGITWECRPEVTGSVELIIDDTLENKVEKTKVAQAQGDMELLNLIIMGGFG